VSHEVLHAAPVPVLIVKQPPPAEAAEPSGTAEPAAESPE
jgi:hypothetical protein